MPQDARKPRLASGASAEDGHGHEQRGKVERQFKSTTSNETTADSINAPQPVSSHCIICGGNPDLEGMRCAGWQEHELAYCQQKRTRQPHSVAPFYVHPIGAGHWCAACESYHHLAPEPRLREERQFIETRHGVFGLTIIYALSADEEAEAA